MTAAFGDIIREWRAIRRFSQLQLSLEAETSARHVSFLESGRARPSRAMVLKLAAALDMPKGAANLAMHAAGFAPAFPSLPSDSKDLTPVRDAIAMMLANHAPFPAIAIDRGWNIVDANVGAATLLQAFGNVGSPNLIDALIAAGDGEAIENWTEIALLTLARLRSEIVHYGGDDALAALSSRLAAHPRLEDADIDAVDYTQAVIPSVFAVGEERLSLFTVLAQFGAVQDVNASEIRVEMMFPADETTRRYFNRLQN